MKRWLMLLCLLPSLVLAEPQVRVESRLVPDSKALVGGTVQLQVDVLTDTWFTAAPQLQALTLPGALVSQPGGEANHLNQQRDGSAWFGLRFHYQITPQQAQTFHIPALKVQLSLGQGSGPVSVATTPLDFVASQPAGLSDGQQVLVAQGVKLTQHIETSHTPLRVGDSIVRRLTLEAEGAQAMSLAAPAFVEIDGLQRYVKTPQVGPLTNGRGSISGGGRVDEVSYVIEQPGDYQLPAIEVQWWDSAGQVLRTSSVPAQRFTASAGSDYQAPFSIAEDLRALGWHARVQISKYWLLWLPVLILAVLARYWGRRGLTAWRAWRSRRQQAYRQSAAFAWQHISGQLRGRPVQLGALYLWGRRYLGSHTLGAVARKVSQPAAQRLLAFVQRCYGPSAQPAHAVRELQRALPELKASARRHRAQTSVQPVLVPLNPRQPKAGPDHKEAQ